jgi:hypothetical protein
LLKSKNCPPGEGNVVCQNYSPVETAVCEAWNGNFHEYSKLLSASSHSPPKSRREMMGGRHPQRVSITLMLATYGRAKSSYWLQYKRERAGHMGPILAAYHGEADFTRGFSTQNIESSQ